MVPPGTLLPNQLQPNLTIAVPPKPEDTIVVCDNLIYVDVGLFLFYRTMCLLLRLKLPLLCLWGTFLRRPQTHLSDKYFW